MKLEPFEWIALVGALAWLPHLISYIRNVITKSQIRIITEKSAELGFTTFGPIINLRVAFAVKNKDIVISNVNMKVTHESGDSRTFSWFGVTQKMLQMNTRETGPIPFEKELTVLAVKLSTKDIEERLIRFQDTKYHDEKGELEGKAVKKLSYLTEKGDVDYPEFLNSEEMNDLYSYIKQSFSWKTGTYSVEFQLESPEPFSLVQQSYKFSLSPIDIQQIEKNKALIEKFYESQVGQTDSEQERLVWNWRHPAFRRAT